MPPSKVELYAAIRRDARAGMSGRAIEKKYRVGRRTIVKALASAWPEPRKDTAPRGSRLDRFKPVIDEMLKADLDAPRKQRHTVTRIWRRLADEHGMDDVSYPVVRRYVAGRRPEIRAEAGRGPAEVFLRQSHRPGDEAEAGFGEVVVRLAGTEVRCFLFCLRLSFSGKAVHRVSLSGGQEAFLEGHEHAFRVLGGVPAGKVRYDNLKAAVAQVIGFSRARVEAGRWTAFRSRWGLDAFYCQPGIKGAHEKGGVEGQIGWFRRNHLVPVPDVASIAALNALVDQWDEQDEARRVGGRARTVGEFLALERPLLRPLPEEPFETGLLLTPRVDRYSQLLTELPELFPQVNRLISERCGMVASHDRGRVRGTGSGRAGGACCGSAAGDRRRVGAVPADRPGRGRGGRGRCMVPGFAGRWPVGGHAALVRDGPAALVPVLVGGRGRVEPGDPVRGV
jgi:transposase